jgi:hypothetical protein
MDRLWKHLMQLDARALFFGAVALLVVVIAIVAWLYLHRTPATAQTQKMTDSAISAVCSNIGVLEIVSNQMSADALVVPVNPFRPGIENMGAGGTSGSKTNLTHIRSAKTNLFAGLRPSADNEPVIPTFTFRGYFQRPDRTAAALFYNSADNVSCFYTPGDKIGDAKLLATTIHTAKVQKPDGQTVELAIGDSFTIHP